MARQNYSAYKHQPLAKPMMIVASDGTIIEILGPYVGTANDASIINSDLQRGPSSSQPLDSGSDEEISFPKRKATFEADNLESVPGPDADVQDENNPRQRIDSLRPDVQENQENIPDQDLDGQNENNQKRRKNNAGQRRNILHQNTQGNQKNVSARDAMAQNENNSGRKRRNKNKPAQRSGIPRPHAQETHENTPNPDGNDQNKKTPRQNRRKKNNAGQSNGTAQPDARENQENTSDRDAHPQSESNKGKKRKKAKFNKKDHRRNRSGNSSDEEEDEEFIRLIKDIMKKAMKDDASRILAWMDLLDILILDRGFRDCLEFLKFCGLDAYMPAYLERKQKQHTTEEANRSRLTTKVRWPVESANGRIKRWAILANRIDNKNIKHLKAWLLIVAALCNKYRPPIASDKPEDEQLAKEMLEKVSQPNRLEQRVKKGKFSSRGRGWVPMQHAEIQDFPKLDLSYLRALTFGVYQLKQARHYVDEHLTPDGEYELQVHPDATDGLLRARIQSRHRNVVKYCVYVQYNSGRETIDEWYCQCKPGCRTVGCCAHICSIIWFLGWARHNGYRTPDTPIKNYTDYLMNVTTSKNNESDSDSD